MGLDSAPLLTLDRMAALTETIGADGVEVLPIRSPLWARLQLPGTGDYKGLFVASHQSFVGLAQEEPAPGAGIAPADLAENKHDGTGLMALAARSLCRAGKHRCVDYTVWLNF